MATSIFTKLSNQSRHKSIFDDLIDPENPPGNPRKVDTVASLAKFGLHLAARCSSCQARASYDAASLSKLFGAEMLMRSVRFACKTCGSMAVQLTPVGAPVSATGTFEPTEAPPPAPAAPPAPMATASAKPAPSSETKPKAAAPKAGKTAKTSVSAKPARRAAKAGAKKPSRPAAKPVKRPSRKNAAKASAPKKPAAKKPVAKKPAPGKAAAKTARKPSRRAKTRR